MLEFALMLIVLLALAGALRWDALRLWWRGFLFEALSPPQGMSSLNGQHLPPAPLRLHDSELQHQPIPRRPDFHRSGRRRQG